jgi:transporter family protein
MQGRCDSMEWVVYALMVALSWGFYGLFLKVTSTYLNPHSALVFYSASGFISSLILVQFFDFTFQTDPKGIVLACTAGVTAAAGSLFLLIAVSRGNVSSVVAVASLYPIISVFLAYIFLGEVIGLRQSIGIVLAIVAVFIISA